VSTNTSSTSSCLPVEAMESTTKFAMMQSASLCFTSFHCAIHSLPVMQMLLWCLPDNWFFGTMG